MDQGRMTSSPPNTAPAPVDAVIVAEIELTPEEMYNLQEEAKRIEQERTNQLNALGKAIESKWVRLSSNRQAVEERMRKSTRLYYGNLANASNRNVRHNYIDGGVQKTNRPDHNLVKEKCDIAIAQTISQQFSGGDKNWDIKPSPKPDIDPQIALAAAKKMETKIFDQLSASKYGPKCRQALADRVILGIGILKGPVPSLEKRRRYEVSQDPNTGKPIAIPAFDDSVKPEVSRVDPWMFYVDDSVNRVCDAEFAVEVHPMNPTQLKKLAKSDGFFDDVIRELLEVGPDEYNSEFFQDVAALTDTGENYLRNKFAVLEYHGPITKDDLSVLGVETTYDSLDDTFMGEVWVCNGRVIRAALEVIEGAYELPYMADVWADDPNSPYGFSLPLLMEDAQRIHTSTLHMMLDNASISGGPQMILNRQYIRPVNNKWEMEPFKIWESTDHSAQSIDQVVKFFFPPNVSSSIEPMLDRAQYWAERESGINLISAGVNSPQAGSDSATGLSILQQQATVVTDMLAEKWDDNVTQRLIDRMYHWNILYDLDPEIVEFDFEVDVRSSTELRNKQMQANNLEKLSVEAAQNPELAKWIDMSALTQTRLTMNRLPDTGIVKSPEQVAQEQEALAQQPQPPDPNMVKLMTEQARAEMERERLTFEREKFQFESTKQLQQLKLEEFVQLQQLEAREKDAQARVMAAQLDYNAKLAELAARSEQHREKLVAMMEAASLNLEAKKFVEGMRIQDKTQDRATKMLEMDLRRETGQGV